MYDEPERAGGVVPTAGRGSLPFALVHGESLVAAASWALEAAEVDLVDLGTNLGDLRATGRDLVVHDPLCPLTPVGFLVEALALAREEGVVVVGVRPVTDTVKHVARGALGETVPREDLVAVASPLVVPAEVLSGPLADVAVLDVDDLATCVAGLAEQVAVRQLAAPTLARRITDTDDLAVLGALDELGR